jgi:DNA modification methylase
MTVLHGDCLDVMATLDAESVDAIVSDPPYGLSFMGKQWDHGVPGEAFWREAWRVAKPGAHLVAFGGTRTYHRLACAIEDAGWEIRDCLSWLYGSGFPKSLDVGKAMDKVNGETDRLHRFTAWMRTTGLTAKQVNAATGTFMGSHYLTAGSQPAIPTPDLWATLRPLIADVPAWVDELVERIEAEREVVKHRTMTQGGGNALQIRTGERREVEANITAPATDLAKQWHGWGTALKPAWEPIILARKPLAGTVAANVAEYGTGAVNVDGCRIEGAPPSVPQPRFGSHTGQVYGFKAGEGRNGAMSRASGRWPANVVLDEAAAGMLDVQTGIQKSGVAGKRTGQNGVGNWGYGAAESVWGGYGDSGGASRFFYTAKASRREREAGLEGMEERTFSAMSGRREADKMDEFKTDNDVTERFTRKASNHHPTVKPIALMRWLCRLVTPKGGLILDPFTGSGTTGCAAVLEGFRFVGIEREAEYVAIAERRIAHWAGQRAEPDLFT